LALSTDYQQAAGLTPAERGMLDFAVKLTLRITEMSQDDTDRLRQLGFTDGAIYDIVAITGMFNMYNRLAEGLGVDPE